jgi:hypothetical protein
LRTHRTSIPGHRRHSRRHRWKQSRWLGHPNASWPRAIRPSPMI